MLPEDAIERRLNDLRDTLVQVGQVTGTSGTRAVVSLRGATLTIPVLASYTPTAGDTVIIIGPPYIVLGKPA